MAKTAIFKNHTNTAQIFLDVPSGGVVLEKVRVLPGSRIELPVEFGRKHRKVLTEVVSASPAAKAKSEAKSGQKSDAKGSN